MKGDYKKFKTQCKQGVYQIYKEKYKDHPDKLGYWDYRTFLQIMSEEIFNALCENPDGFKMPMDIGVFKIVGSKVKRPLEKTKMVKLKKFLLGATEGHVYAIRWYPNLRGGLRNITFYQFRTSIIYKRALYKEILAGRYLKWIRVGSQLQACKLKP